jgi:hypothetical protein
VVVEPVEEAVTAPPPPVAESTVLRPSSRPLSGGLVGSLAAPRPAGPVAQLRLAGDLPKPAVEAQVVSGGPERLPPVTGVRALSHSPLLPAAPKPPSRLRRVGLTSLLVAGCVAVMAFLVRDQLVAQMPAEWLEQAPESIRGWLQSLRPAKG